MPRKKKEVKKTKICIAITDTKSRYENYTNTGIIGHPVVRHKIVSVEIPELSEGWEITNINKIED
jgi:hypothetical protein